MMQTLNLFNELLLRARRLYAADQWREAIAVLRRLESFPDLPARVGEKVQALQGKILLKKRRYRAARKHLRLALRFRPDSARYLFLLGLAHHADPAGNRDKAARYYRRSLELSPGQVRCRSQAGLLAVELGQMDEGVALLREATELAPENTGAVSRLVKGLCRAGRPDAALATVQTALFRSPRSPRLHRLWSDLRLASIRRQQEMTAALDDQAGDGPTILPFVRPAANSIPATRKWRQDNAISLPGPHLLRMRARVARRRAP